MLHELLQLLPTQLVHAPSSVLAWGSAVGVLLWLLGGRLSRSMLTLLAVTAGSWVGVRLPSAFGWEINPVCVGVCGSIVLGVAGYLFHRTLIGVGLGAVASLWAVAAAWIRFDASARWNPSDLHWTGSPATWLATFWHSFPGDLATILPYAFGAGLIGGVLVAVLWPRLGRCALYSLVGSTLILATGMPLAIRLRPHWLEHAPESGRTLFVTLFGFVSCGVAVQWILTREPRKSMAEAGDTTATESGNAAPLIGRRSWWRRATLAEYRHSVPLPAR